MGEGVRVFILEVVLQIVYVEVAIGEGLPGCNVEVTNDLVDANVSLEAASFLALLIEVLGIVLALALLDTLAAAERPRDRGVRITDFIAGIAASGFLCAGWGGSAKAVSAVSRVEMCSFVFVPLVIISWDP